MRAPHAVLLTRLGALHLFEYLQRALRLEDIQDIPVDTPTSSPGESGQRLRNKGEKGWDVANEQTDWDTNTRPGGTHKPGGPNRGLDGESRRVGGGSSKKGLPEDYPLHLERLLADFEREAPYKVLSVLAPPLFRHVGMYPTCGDRYVPISDL